MADETQVVPPKPPAGEIITERALQLTTYALYRNTQAFGGVRDPSIIWSSMLRDDGSAILYYRELEEKDVDVANALNTLKGSVLERKWNIEPADKDDTKAVEVAQFVKDQIANVENIDLVIDNLLDGPGYGFSVQEMIFDPSEGQAGLLDIRDCPQELFLFGKRYTPQIGPMQFLDSPYAGEGTPVPEEKFLIFSYRARSRNRMGRPLLRTVFWSSWFKRNMLRLWAQYAEKGPGTAVVRYSDAASEQEKQQAAEIARALAESVAVAIPQNFDIEKELLTIARSINPDVYEHFFKAMQLDIVRFILGETLTSFGGEDGKGTQALGDVHADTLQMKTVGLAKAAAAVLNRQLVRPLVLWNFGPDAPMPKWTYDVEEKEDLTERLGVDSGLYEMGVQIPVSYVQERYGIPAPVDGEAVLNKPANVAPAVTIRDGASAAFAERSSRLRSFIARSRSQGTSEAEIRTAIFAEVGNQAHAEAELAEMDRLVAQLQGEALPLLGERSGQIGRVLSQTGGR
jgi:phage gp29-like protein